MRHLRRNSASGSSCTFLSSLTEELRWLNGDAVTAVRLVGCMLSDAYGLVVIDNSIGVGFRRMI